MNVHHVKKERDFFCGDIIELYPKYKKDLLLLRNRVDKDRGLSEYLNIYIYFS